jgi:predicted ester cyclase
MCTHRNNERLIKEFLRAAHITQNKDLGHFVAPEVKCWGFPEFNPGNCDEYQGFFNYLADVFESQVFTIQQLLAANSQVLVRFRIQGKHHEEFMGLPASGGELEFTATALFRLDEGKISEVWMYNKHIVLHTPKGYSYTISAASSSISCKTVQAIAC